MILKLLSYPNLYFDKPANLTNQQNFRDVGYMHEAVLKNLIPGQQYYYKFGSKQENIFSDVQTFKAAPKTAAETGRNYFSFNMSKRSKRFPFIITKKTLFRG